MQPIRDLFKAWKAYRAISNTKEKIVAQRLKLGKGLLRSKTFWWNLLTGTATILGLAGTVSFLTPFVPYFAVGSAVVNILLRLVTDKPIEGVK